MFVFDIESNGLLDTISKVHCINAIDRATGREYRFTDHEYYQNVDGSKSDVKCPRDGTIEDGLILLEQADEIGGHHIIGYDIPALDIIYQDFTPAHRQVDSLVLSKLLYPNLKDTDFAAVRKGKLPEAFLKKGLAGRDSLEAWGFRLEGELKADFKPADFGHTWATIPFIKEMDDYCMQDVRVNVAIFEHFESKEYSQEAIDIEMGTQKIISLQERTGIAFNLEAAEELCKGLYIKQHELEQECRSVFPAFYLRDGKPFVPKRDNKSLGYLAGATVQKLKLVDFNPGSNRHVHIALANKYGWEPTELTKTGLAKIDEEILGTLPFVEAKKIAEYRTVNKRLSQIAEGKQAWMKQVKKDGRIYGRVNTLGTVTGRMSHYGPNLAQVPKVGKPYGVECRGLFVCDPGRVVVGCDADAIELRILAHFMARFDKGAYIEVVLNGSKEDGSDMHTRNQQSISLTNRDVAKTYFYAMLYGSGDFNLGTIVMTDWTEEKLTKFYAAYPPGQKRRSKIVAIGKRSRAALMAGLPALAKLVDKVQQSAKRGYLKGLDGRHIPIRSMHAALNSLCQSAGAVLMKRALITMFDVFDKEGLDVLPLLNVHDEVQLSCTKEIADHVGTIAKNAIIDAGIVFSFRCPLDGEFKVGTSWADTH